MKSVLMVFVMVMCSVLPTQSTRAQDPVMEAIRQGIIKVIKAIDLKIQRLQNETIWLQNAQKSVENTMSKLKLDEISDWVEKQRKLYDDYFQELWQVKAAISTYHKVQEVIQLQVRIVQEYKAAYALFQGDKNFTPEEIKYMYQVYSGILNESLKSLDQIFLVVNSFATQMSDAKRREIINAAYDHLQTDMANLKQFNNENKMLSVNRAKSKGEIQRLRTYYGLKP
jgi:hypothetical protein